MRLHWTLSHSTSRYFLQLLSISKKKRAMPSRTLYNVYSGEWVLKNVFWIALANSTPQTTISDLVQISPEDSQKPSAESIEDNINAKYANKVGQLHWSIFQRINCITSHQVIQKIGLCICVYDILKASDGLLGHGTGIVNVNGGWPVFWNHIYSIMFVWKIDICQLTFGSSSFDHSKARSSLGGSVVPRYSSWKVSCLSMYTEGV